MTLTDTEKHKIAVQEAYRAKLREQNEYRNSISEPANKPKQSKVLLILLALLAFPLLAALIVVIANPTKKAEEAKQTQLIESVIGRHAYNKTNGVYRGRILQEKPCTTSPSQQCYLLEVEGASRNMEAPVSNIDVKDISPQE